MIEVERVSKHFGHIKAVRDVSFQVDTGEILGFLGPNGAGKTTTMRLLNGFFPPSSGSARVAGLDVFEDSLAIRKKIGYLPENVPLYGEMTVNEYLRFVSEAKGVSRSKRTAEVGAAAETCGVNDLFNRFINKLSKGYRQRVGLAQALIGNPEVLILDEPTIGLDPRQINEIRNVIKDFAGEKTVILSTHILPEVSMTCQKVAIINQGRVVVSDTLENLNAQAVEGGRIRMRIGGPAQKVRETLANLPGVRNIATQGDDGIFLIEGENDLQPRLASAVSRSGWDLYEMSVQAATLEEIFIRLVNMDEEAPADE